MADDQSSLNAVEKRVRDALTEKLVLREKS
jgi:hypothetical protein